jgi:hypothetical protein
MDLEKQIKKDKQRLENSIKTIKLRIEDLTKELENLQRTCENETVQLAYIDILVCNNVPTPAQDRGAKPPRGYIQQTCVDLLSSSGAPMSAEDICNKMRSIDGYDAPLPTVTATLSRLLKEEAILKKFTSRKLIRTADAKFKLED